MRVIILTALVLMMSTVLLFAQNTKAEQEVLKVNSDYDKAILKGDISFHERLLAPEYVSYNPDASARTRSEVLERMKKEKATPTFKLTALASDDVKVKVAGNLAVVTARWNSTGTAMETDAEPHTDQGYYTAVYEKRNGRWMLLSDHATEKPHTTAELEPSLRKASESFDKALETKNAALFEKLLAEDYTSTNEAGRISNKKDEIAQMTSPDFVLTSAKADDKNFRIYRNSAVETGRYSVTGTYKGKNFSETGRYTSSWIYKDGKWQIAADHTSVITDKSTAANSGQ
jgi:ketosteroid isomerase-like protein